MIFCWLYWNWKPRKLIILVVFGVLGGGGEGIEEQANVVED